MPTPTERFAEEFNVTVDQVKDLNRKIKSYITAYTSANNCRDAKLALALMEVEENRTTVVEATAKAMGFDGIDWPGLYPTLRKGTRHHIEIPFD